MSMLTSLDHSARVRPATRAAWEQLAQAGNTPSVRKVYDLVGGAYNIVTAECQVLREEAQAHAASPSGDASTAPEATLAEAAPEETALLPLVEAQAAVTQATAVLDRLTTDYEAEARRLQHLEERARALEAILRLDPTPTQQAALTEARRARLDSELRIRDIEALRTEQQAVIEHARQQVMRVETQAHLQEYNRLAAGRAPLLTTLEEAWQGFADALQALSSHNTEQKKVASSLGFGDLLNRVPFIVPAEHMPEGFAPARTDGVLNRWVYAKIAALLPAPPRPKDSRRYPPRFPHLGEADVAQTPLSWSQYQALQAPRPHRLERIEETHRGAENYTNLAPFGIPALAIPHEPFPVSRPHWERLRLQRQFQHAGAHPVPPAEVAGFASQR